MGVDDEDQSIANPDLDVLDVEEAEDDAPLDIPPEKRRVKTDKQDVPVETIHGWVKRGKVDLQPDFQRMFVWNLAKASRLIESLLLEIPIPVVYVAEEASKNYAVVDGQQRLTSICAFIDGKLPDDREFKLSSLQVLTELNGKRFKELPREQQEAILGAILRVIVITQDSNPDVKFEVFERLNLGAVKLNDQELRNCMYRGSYNRLLAELAENATLKKILGNDKADSRMRDRQLILRFFAMWRSSHLKYRGSMKRFLNHEMEEHRELPNNKLTEMRSVFANAIEIAYTVFGRNAFRRFNPGRANAPDGSWEAHKLNVALWDTLLYTFAYYDKRQMVPIADRVREEFLDLISNDATFADYISRTTDNVERIKYRADTWRQRLDLLVVTPANEPRGFSSALKESLHKANPTCGSCGQRIRELDDAEVDHVEHYWRGGKTIPENARLTHRYCNRARGGRN